MCSSQSRKYKQNYRHCRKHAEQYSLLNFRLILQKSPILGVSRLHQYNQRIKSIKMSTQSTSTHISTTSKHLKDISRTVSPCPKIKIDLTRTQYPILRTVANFFFEYRMWRRSEQKDEASLIWFDTYIPDEVIKKLRPYQRVNHFPNSEELGRKDKLAINLMRCRGRLPQQYDFFPQTWLLPRDIEQFRKNHCSERYYIAKPEAGSQGRGIFLFQNVDGLKLDEPFVVQQYIDRPFLIEHLKFDFRIYVLLRSINPLRIYVYQEGLARLATQPYEYANNNNVSNLTMHLTNYAINKKSPSFIFNNAQDEDNIGHKRSYTAVLEILRDMGKNTDELEKQINHIIVKTIISAQAKLSEAYRACRPAEQSTCFELLGFDIMLDQTMKPYLIEVNHSPSFTTDTPLDTNIKKHLILDTINLLNLSYNDKKNFLIRKQAQNQKITSGLIFAQQMQQAEYEKNHLGGFKKVYPSDNAMHNKLYDEIRDNLLESRRRKVVGLQRVSLPTAPRRSRMMYRQNSSQKQLEIRPISRTADMLGETALGFYNLSDSSVERKQKSSHSRRLMNSYHNTAIDEQQQPLQSSSVLDSELVNRKALKLTNIKFQTSPQRPSTTTSSVISQFRLFKQYQQYQQQQALCKNNNREVVSQNQGDLYDLPDDQFYILRKKYKKVSLFNFQQSTVIQKKFKNQSRKAIQGFVNGLTYSSYQNVNKFNPVRHWNNVPKLRFHKIKNMRGTSVSTPARPFTDDEVKKRIP